MADAPGRDAGVRPAGGGRPVGRRQALAALAAQGGEAALAGQGLAGDGAPPAPRAATGPGAVGYAPDGVAGRKAAFPLSAVRLLETPFARNQARNTAYLLFLDPDRMLHTARLNYGQPSPAQPCGGWEAPGSEVRGHNTGHLMSALALTFASTGNAAARARGRYLVSQLAALQALARPTGFHRGYCRRSRKVSSTGWRAASGYGRRTT